MYTCGLSLSDPSHQRKLGIEQVIHLVFEDVECDEVVVEPGLPDLHAYVI